MTKEELLKKCVTRNQLEIAIGLVLIVQFAIRGIESLKTDAVSGTILVFQVLGIFVPTIILFRDLQSMRQRRKSVDALFEQQKRRLANVHLWYILPITLPGLALVLWETPTPVGKAISALFIVGIGVFIYVLNQKALKNMQHAA